MKFGLSRPHPCQESQFLIERGHIPLREPSGFGFIATSNGTRCNLSRIITPADWEAINRRFHVPDNVYYLDGLIQDGINRTAIRGYEVMGTSGYEAIELWEDREHPSSLIPGVPWRGEDDTREVIPESVGGSEWRHLVPLAELLIERGHGPIAFAEQHGFGPTSDGTVCSLAGQLTLDDWHAVNERFALPDHIFYADGLIRDRRYGVTIRGYAESDSAPSW